MSPRLSPRVKMREFQQECLKSWRRCYEIGPRDARLLLDDIKTRPDGWIAWRQDPGFPDEMIAHIWNACLADTYDERNELSLARLAASWQNHLDILEASPVLGTAATGLLIAAVAMDIKDSRKFRAALRTVLEAAPRQEPVRYSTGQLMNLVDATAGHHALSAPFLPVVARHLGVAPAIVRAAWVVRSPTRPPGGCRSRIATLLARAPVATQQGATLAGDLSPEEPFAATPWSFYQHLASPLLWDSLFMEGDEGVIWAWAHPAWRAPLLAHATNLVLDTAALWSSPRQVRAALETMAGHAGAWSPDTCAHIVPWLHVVLGTAPLDAWSRVAAILATASDDPGRTRGLWDALTKALRSRPQEVVEPSTWLPWLQSTDGHIRAEAMLLASAGGPSPAATPGRDLRREAAARGTGRGPARPR